MKISLSIIFLFAFLTDSKSLLYERFIEQYKPDYALLNHELYGIAKKDNKWAAIHVYAQSTLSKEGNPKIEKKIRIARHELTAEEAEQVLSSAAVDSTFLISQHQLDSLPKTCLPDPEKPGSGIGGRVSDASQVEIREYKNGQQRNVKFYAADQFFRHCYPYHQEYAILRPLLNTDSVLYKAFNKLATNKNE